MSADRDWAADQVMRVLADEGESRRRFSPCSTKELAYRIVDALNVRPQWTGSFPFLQIAQTYGADYGAVVRCAQLFEDSDRFAPVGESYALGEDVIDAVIAAVELEALRREKVIHG